MRNLLGRDLVGGLIRCYQVKLVKGGLAEAIEITKKGSRYLIELKNKKTSVITTPSCRILPRGQTNNAFFKYL